MGKLTSVKINNGLLVTILLATIACVSMGFIAVQKQQDAELVLHNNQLKTKPAGFYLTEIIDQRTVKNHIGNVVLADNHIAKTTVVPAVIRNGMSAVTTFFKSNAPEHAGYRPYLLHIKTLLLSESALADGRVNGNVELSVSFDLKTGEELSVHLSDYNTTLRYTRTTAQQGVAETMLNQVLENTISYINNWTAAHADTNPVLARQVKLTFTDYTETPETDTIYYSAQRPLTWADFKDKPRSGKYAAEVFPGLGYTEETSVNKGIIFIRIAMKAYVPKSGCWVKPGNQDEYTLNHEQRHFDIVKIISERFKHNLLQQKLSVQNYDGDINVAYFDALHDMDVMQKQYDAETLHGINVSAQQKWNKYIDEQLTLARVRSGS